jgi:hypothetical protein
MSAGMEVAIRPPCPLAAQLISPTVLVSNATCMRVIPVIGGIPRLLQSYLNC